MERDSGLGIPTELTRFPTVRFQLLGGRFVSWQAPCISQSNGRPILEPPPRPPGCHHITSRVSDPLDPGWLDCQLQISCGKRGGGGSKRLLLELGFLCSSPLIEYSFIKSPNEHFDRALSSPEAKRALQGH